MAKINEELVTKVLKDLNLTPKQVIDDGLMEGLGSYLKGLGNKVGTALSNATVPTPSGADARITAAMAPPGANLRDALVNTMGSIKNTSQKLEAQASQQTTVTPDVAAGMVKEINNELAAGAKSISAAYRNPAPTPAPVVPPSPTSPVAPAGMGMQNEGNPTVSQDLTKRPALLNPWTNPQGQFVRLTPEQEATLNPQQKQQYVAAVQAQVATNTGAKPKPTPPPASNVGAAPYGPNSWTVQ